MFAAGTGAARPTVDADASAEGMEERECVPPMFGDRNEPSLSKCELVLVTRDDELSFARLSASRAAATLSREMSSSSKVLAFPLPLSEDVEVRERPDAADVVVVAAVGDVVEENEELKKRTSSSSANETLVLLFVFFPSVSTASVNTDTLWF